MSGNSIADSSAVRLPGKVLAQHHTAITLLGEMLAGTQPGDSLDWLDLACGRGQMITNLKETIPDGQMRSKIRYLGFDIANDYTRETEKLAATLKLGAVDTLVGQLDHFPGIVRPEKKFSFITFTNVVHEIQPTLFGALLLELIRRMKPDAKLYVYDMETLPEPELGAVTWDAADVKRLLSFIFKELGGQAVPPSVPRWPHSSCMAWSINFSRERLDVNAQLFDQVLPELTTKTGQFIKKLFKEKLRRTTEALQDITKYGGQTAEEQKKKINLLFDYWSLSQL